jgi:hypothetical protein
MGTMTSGVWGTGAGAGDDDAASSPPRGLEPCAARADDVDITSVPGARDGGLSAAAALARAACN